MGFLAFGILAAILVTNSVLGQSIDEMIAGASKVKELDYLTDLDGQTVMQELDMVLMLDQWKALQGYTTSRKKRKAIRDARYRWTEKTIPYRISSGKFSGRDLGEINRAIKEWETHTCIRFTPATSHRNYVNFDDGSGCYSYVGMVGGAQTIGLAGGCRHKGVIVHEIGHAVGFHHEQNRPDRHKHVRINFQNIPEQLHYNFKQYPSSSVNTYDVPYDFGSVMHYGGRAFSRNGQLTIQTLNRGNQGKIGNRQGLSFYDVMLANLMYKCSEGCDASIRCKDGAFLGKDCKCYCPGNPVRECDAETGGKTASTTTPRPEKTTAPACKNMNQYCGAWAKAGYCTSSTYMKMYCKESCDLCNSGPTQAVCVDEKEHCAYWAAEGYCRGEYESFMKNYCEKSCDYCQASELSGNEMDDNSSVALSGTVAVMVSSLLMLVSAFVFS